MRSSTWEELWPKCGGKTTQIGRWYFRVSIRSSCAGYDWSESTHSPPVVDSPRARMVTRERALLVGVILPGEVPVQAPKEALQTKEQDQEDHDQSASDARAPAGRLLRGTGGRGRRSRLSTHDPRS